MNGRGSECNDGRDMGKATEADINGEEGDVNVVIDAGIMAEMLTIIITRCVKAWAWV